MDQYYLNHLQTEQGQKLTYERLGSMVVDGISGSVDIYALYLEDKSIFMEIYVSVYGMKNSTVAPKGLIIV